MGLGQKIDFVHFDIRYSTIFLLSESRKFINYHNFPFYDHLSRGYTIKYRKKQTLRNTKLLHLNSSFGNKLVQKCQFWVRERY